MQLLNILADLFTVDTLEYNAITLKAPAVDTY